MTSAREGDDSGERAAGGPPCLGPDGRPDFTSVPPGSPQARLIAAYEAKRPQLLAYINRQIGPRLRQKVEAEDVMQETLLDALRRIGEFERLARSPFGWLCQIAEHRLIDAHRKHFGAKKRTGNREVSLDADRSSGPAFADLLVVSLTTPSLAISRKNKEFRLQTALGELSDEVQDALRMRYVEGLPTKEIAERIGKTDGAVRVLLTRAVQRLQAQLRE